MFCPKCGSEVLESAQWCPKCGSPLSAPTPSPIVNAQPQTAPGAIAGFSLSLAGLLLYWTPVIGLALSIAGVSICNKGKKEVDAKPNAYTNTGLLSAGRVIGIIGIVGGVVALIVGLISLLILGGGFFSILDFAKDMATLSN